MRQVKKDFASIWFGNTILVDKKLNPIIFLTVARSSIIVANLRYKRFFLVMDNGFFFFTFGHWNQLFSKKKTNEKGILL
jgi:hypothetical protein